MFGYCLHYGLGIEKNSETAVKYYQLSADQGTSIA